MVWMPTKPPGGDEPEPRCRKCGYIVRGLPEPVCPECGSDLRLVGFRRGWRRPDWIVRMPPWMIRSIAWTAFLLAMIFPVTVGWRWLEEWDIVPLWQDVDVLHTGIDMGSISPRPPLECIITIGVSGRGWKPVRQEMCIALARGGYGRGQELGRLTVDPRTLACRYLDPETKQAIEPMGSVCPEIILEWWARLGLDANDSRIRDYARSAHRQFTSLRSAILASERPWTGTRFDYPLLWSTTGGWTLPHTPARIAAMGWSLYAMVWGMGLWRIRRHAPMRKAG